MVLAAQAVTAVTVIPRVLVALAEPADNFRVQLTRAVVVVQEALGALVRLEL